MIGARRFAFGQRRQVIVAGENFADAFPQPGMHLHHHLDVVDRVHVGGIEAADERVQARLLLGGQGQNVLRQHRVGGAVVVDRRLVAHVIARLLGRGLLPLFDHPQAHDRHVVDVGLVHGPEQRFHAVGFLHEIDVMQLRVGVDAVGGGHRGQQQGKRGQRTEQHFVHGHVVHRRCFYRPSGEAIAAQGGAKFRCPPLSAC